jgi:polyhydroxybutyrate depolymerase
VVAGAACSDDGGSPSAGATSTTGRALDCAPARPHEPGSTRRTFSFAGVDRAYELAVPEGYDGESKVPLVLNLHGFTSDIDEQNALSHMPEVAGARGYVVVTPQALNVDVPLPDGTLNAPLWNIADAFTVPAEDADVQYEAGDDVGFLLALLDELERTLCVDVDREYVTGMSNGAGMTVVLICTDDRRFAGAAPVAGVNLATICAAQRATPTIAFHGDADALVDYRGGSIYGYDLGLPSVEERMTELARLGGCDAAPATTQPSENARHAVWSCPEGMGAELYTIVGGGHTWPGAAQHVDATELMLDFFDAHRRG